MNYGSKRIPIVRRLVLNTGLDLCEAAMTTMELVVAAMSEQVHSLQIP
jgi:hypothetical protein